MPTVGFEPTISVLERAKTVRVLDRAATAIGYGMNSDFTRPETEASFLVSALRRADPPSREAVIPYTVGRTPWMGNQRVASPLP
jgi:hypothetical protein